MPFKEGTAIEISISKRERKKNLENLINNDHVWTDDDIMAIERGRAIIKTLCVLRVFAVYPVQFRRTACPVNSLLRLFHRGAAHLTGIQNFQNQVMHVVHERIYTQII